MPMISEFTPSIAASVSKEDGTKCCLKDVSLPPIDFDQYSGTVTGSLGITLNLPGWNGSYGFGYQGIFYVSFSYALGPNITLTPSLAASVVGLDYDSSEPNCKSCISVGINASVGVAIGFGGNVTATVAIYPGTIWEWGVVAQINIGVNLSSSINGGVAYKWDMCPEPGVSGTIGYGQLVGQANAGLTLFGYVLSYSWSVTLLQGGTLQFP